MTQQSMTPQQAWQNIKMVLGRAKIEMVEAATMVESVAVVEAAINPTPTNTKTTKRRNVQTKK